MMFENDLSNVPTHCVVLLSSSALPVATCRSFNFIAADPEERSGCVYDERVWSPRALPPWGRTDNQKHGRSHQSVSGLEVLNEASLSFPLCAMKAPNDVVFFLLPYLPQTFWPQCNFPTFHEISSYVFYSTAFFFFVFFLFAPPSPGGVQLRLDHRGRVCALTFLFPLAHFHRIIWLISTCKTPKSQVFFSAACYLSGSE